MQPENDSLKELHELLAHPSYIVATWRDVVPHQKLDRAALQANAAPQQKHAAAIRTVQRLACTATSAFSTFDNKRHIGHSRLQHSHPSAPAIPAAVALAASTRDGVWPMVSSNTLASLPRSRRLSNYITSTVNNLYPAPPCTTDTSLRVLQPAPTDQPQPHLPAVESAGLVCF